MFKISIKFTKF